MTEDAPIPSFHLAGYLAAGEDRDAFVVPVFRGFASNRLLTQSIGADGNIDGLHPLADAGKVRSNEDEAIRITMGAGALWAFVRADGTLHVVKRTELVEILATIPTDHMGPFLRLEVAQFRGQDQEASTHLKAAYAHLARSSPKSAAAWRDVVVLPPNVRAAVLDTANDYGLADLTKDLNHSVAVSVNEGRLEITLPGDLHDALAGKSAATLALRRRLRPLRLAFGLSHAMVLTSVAAKARAAEIRRLADVTIVAVGERAIAIARHALSDERSANGSVRRLPHHESDGGPPIGVVEAAGVRLLTTAQAFGLETHIGRTLVILTAVDRDDPASALVAQELADRYRKTGVPAIVVVPHLPNTLATDDEISLWRKLGSGFDSLWAISDLSPHTRQSLSYGGGRSEAAASGRLIEFLALAADDDFPIVARPKSSDVGVSVFGSAVGDVSPGGLLNHAAMRISTPSIRLEEADLAIATVSDGVPDERWLHDVLKDALPSVRTTGISMPTGLHGSRGLLAVIGAELRPVSVADFDNHCIRELRLSGWNVHSDRVGEAMVVDSEEGPWNMVGSPGRIVTVSALTDGWHDGRRDLRFTDRTIGRRDFLAGVLLGSVPVSPNRIPVLAKILRGRWRTAVGIARDRRVDASEIFVGAALARLNDGLPDE